jgi:hypothetical protein
MHSILPFFVAIAIGLWFLAPLSDPQSLVGAGGDGIPSRRVGGGTR